MAAPHAADAQFWKLASSPGLGMSKWPPPKSMPALPSCSSMASGLNILSLKRLVSKGVYGNCAPRCVRHSAWPKSGGCWCTAGCPCSLPPPVSVDCLLMLK